MNCVTCGKNINKPKKKFCSNACKQKDHFAKIKKNNPNSSYNQLKGYITRKMEAIIKMGGKCVKCGYNKNLSALDFHHKDPSQKLFQLDARSFANRDKKKIEEELCKCVLLCANCHREEHNPELEISAIKIKPNLFKKIKITTESKCKKCNNIKYDNNSNLCRSCYVISRRIFDRPEKDQLLNDLVELKNSSQIAKKYSCSHKTIEKWFYGYGLDYKKLKTNAT